MQIFTASDDELANNSLNETESKHCVRVLRKKTGDIINITNGKGKLIQAEITDAHQKHCSFKVINEESTPQLAPDLHIAIAPTKNIDRFEFFLEKVTEIGVSEITPLLCFHSERKNIKLERLEKIITSACKQSKNFHFPKLNDLTPIKELLNSNEAQKLIAHCTETEKKHLKDYKFNKPTLILIGPEGDYSEEEINWALENNFQPISLGESRLRTETAGIVACTIVNLGYA